ncbi:unnamed protein product [Brassica rapa subsp. narinosa]|uniref:(rape) hypothetical protein n=1 Tax=Brassica napus TaxID=3708 RepID=A0A816VE51_BRANA|nr:unnamed protein product [Brassica napus]
MAVPFELFLSGQKSFLPRLEEHAVSRTREELKRCELAVLRMSSHYDDDNVNTSDENEIFLGLGIVLIVPNVNTGDIELGVIGDVNGHQEILLIPVPRENFVFVNGETIYRHKKGHLLPREELKLARTTATLRPQPKTTRLQREDCRFCRSNNTSTRRNPKQNLAELCRKRTPKMRIPDQSMRVSVTKSRQRQRPLRHQSPTKWISG